MTGQVKALIVLGSVFGAFVVFLLLNPFTFVPVGYRGIAMRLGTPTGQIREEGVHFKLPLVEGNKNVEVRVQKKEVDAAAASKDLQTVTSKIAVNFSVDPKSVIDLYRSVGDDYDDRIVAPAIQESVKATTARYTAEELITKRNEVSDAMLVEIKERVQSYGITASELNIVDFDFSPSFNAAIEAKVSAEQNALAAKNKLEQVKYESQQAVESAKGRAEALTIEGQAVQRSPEVAQLRAIEKWNGVLPTTMVPGQTIPFIGAR